MIKELYIKKDDMKPVINALLNVGYSILIRKEDMTTDTLCLDLIHSVYDEESFEALTEFEQFKLYQRREDETEPTYSL